MTTIEPESAILPADVVADIQAVADAAAAGRPVAEEVARRVRERGERTRADVLRRHGHLDVGVPAIRELRGELPGS